MADLRAAASALREPETGVAVVVEHTHELWAVTDVSDLVADLLEALADGFYGKARRAAGAFAAAVSSDAPDTDSEGTP